MQIRRAGVRATGLAMAGSSASEETMQSLFRRTRDLLSQEDGPAAVEYAVMLAVVIGIGLATMATFGEEVYAMYVTIVTAVGLN